MFNGSVFCTSTHPNHFHGSIAGQHPFQCVLGLLKLLQQLPVLLLGYVLSFLQLLPALLQVHHSWIGHTHKNLEFKKHLLRKHLANLQMILSVKSWRVILQQHQLVNTVRERGHEAAGWSSKPHTHTFHLHTAHFSRRHGSICFLDLPIKLVLTVNITFHIKTAYTLKLCHILRV